MLGIWNYRYVMSIGPFIRQAVRHYFIVLDNIVRLGDMGQRRHIKRF